ncbi:MAG: hypothetical protein KDD70_15405 [Bdellovibrionales bacterium]|nr:hypothetical protein [Bdellovibrionales bacterium]
MDRLPAKESEKYTICFPPERWLEIADEIRDSFSQLGPCRWFQNRTIFNIWDNTIDMRNDLTPQMLVDTGDDLVTIAVLERSSSCFQKLKKLEEFWIEKYDVAVMRPWPW